MRKRNCNMKLTGVAAAMAGVGAMLSLPAFALKVYEEGDLNVTVDTNLSVGAAWRASDVNLENVGPANGGTHLHNTGVQDNADLRWEKGSPFSEVVKATVDLQVEYQDYGAFVRGKAFYDQAIMKGDGGTDLPEFYPTSASGNPTEPAQDAGRSGEILDAFVWGNWMVQDMPLNARLGQQVINWGEGVLFPNGINTINPIDVNALLTPGAELKEALIPVKVLYSSIGLSDNLSAEFFYQFEWEETRAPDCGTFFNTIDLVGQNCNGGFYALGGEAGALVEPINNVFLPAANYRLGRGADIDAKDGGEYGIAARYYVDSIQTEVGVYYMNYHSRLPILSGYAPNEAASNASGLLAVGPRLTTASYVVEYPEDIQLLGVSFNTNFDLGLPGGESAVSGEISYRKDQPFQVEDSVLLTGLIGAPSQLCSGSADANCFNEYDPEEFITGGIRDDFYQAEAAFIHFFDRALGADRWTVLLNMAYNYAAIPDKSDLLMNSAYNADLRPAWSALVDPAISATVITDAGVRAINDTLYNGGTGEDNLYPTKSSYGYKLRMSGEYSNVFAGVNLVPTISFGHDVKGVTPGPVANFLEDRKSLGLSVEANYLNMYKVEMGYTDFYGAEPYNQLNDRDFYSLSASVSF
jgi:hypothetical protein